MCYHQKINNKILKYKNFFLSEEGKRVYRNGIIDLDEFKNRLCKKYSIEIEVEYGKLEHWMGMNTRIRFDKIESDGNKKTIEVAAICIDETLSQCLKRYVLLKELLHILDERETFLPYNQNTNASNKYRVLSNNGILPLPVVTLKSLDSLISWLDCDEGGGFYVHNLREAYIGNADTLLSVNNIILKHCLSILKNNAINDTDKIDRLEHYADYKKYVSICDDLLKSRDLLVGYKDWFINEELVKFVACLILAPVKSDENVLLPNVVDVIFREKILGFAYQVSLDSSLYVEDILNRVLIEYDNDNAFPLNKRFFYENK